VDNKFNVSLFERLDRHFKSWYSRLGSNMKDFGNSPVILLDRQYRMHPQIASFPNEYIYNGRIQDDVYVVFLYI